LLLGLETPLVALDSSEGSGNLYLTNVAVIGCDNKDIEGAGDAGGAGAGGTGAGGAGGTGAGGAGGTGAGGAGGTRGAAEGSGAENAEREEVGGKFLKIIRLFNILTNPRSNVINPFNISLVDEI
jgi:hypothetical protein